MLRAHRLHSGEIALLLRHLDGEDALAAAVLQRVVGHRGALAVAALGDHEQVARAATDLHTQDLGTLGHRDTAHAARIAAGLAHLILAEHNGLAGGGGHDDPVALAHALHGKQAVALFEADGDDAVAAAAVVSLHDGLLDHAARGGEQQVLVLGELAAADDARDLLAVLERQQVHDRGAARLARTLGQLMDLQAVDLALVGEEQHVLVGARDEHLVDDIVLFEVRSGHALAAALLRAVGGHGDALHVAGMGDGDDHLLVGDEVLDVERALGGLDLGAALVAELAADLAHLLLDHGEDLLLVRQQVLVVGDGAAQAVQLLLNLVALETRQAAKLHLEDGRGLLGREAEALDQAAAGLGVGARGADDRDDLVDVVESHEIALEDMRAGLGLLEIETRAAGDDVDLVVDVVLQHLGKREAFGHAVHERQVVGAEGGLQARVLVQVVEDDLRDNALLELDDQAQALLVGLVAHVGDALDALLVYQLGDLLLQGALVDHVGNLGKDQAVTAGLGRLHMSLGAHRDGAAAGLVGLLDALGAHDDGARGEVRAGHDLHELVDRRIGVVDQVAGGLDGLGEVVRRDVGGHTDRDALAAVDQQIGEARGQALGLGERLVVVGLPVHGVFLQVAQQLHGGLGQAALGVAHGGRGVAVDVAEVAVTVDERGAHGEPLRQADHGLVDRGVTVRVVLTDNLADRPGRLLVRAVGVDAALVHRVEDTTVHRLQAVAHVRQGACRDDRHRVLDEGLLHLAAELRDLELSAVDVLAGCLATLDGTEALLELAVVLGLVVLAFGFHIDVGLGIVALLGACQQPLQIVRHALARGLLVIVHIVCHVTSLVGRGALKIQPVVLKGLSSDL